jgi:hypothetical protein
VDGRVQSRGHLVAEHPGRAQDLLRTLDTVFEPLESVSEIQAVNGLDAHGPGGSTKGGDVISLRAARLADAGH